MNKKNNLLSVLTVSTEGMLIIIKNGFNSTITALFLDVYVSATANNKLNLIYLLF